MINSFSEEDCKRLLTVMLLTDGYFGFVNGCYPKFAYYSNDSILLDIFEKLFLKAYGMKRSHRGASEVYYKQISPCTNAYSDLTATCGDFNKKTCPDLHFLSTCNREVRRFALRLGMSAEGYVSVSRKDNGSLRTLLGFACANEKLGEAWAKLFRDEGVNMRLRRDAHVSTGIHGIETVAHDDIIAFERFGGFLDGVRIQKGKRFKGVDKNAVLRACVAFIKRIREKQLRGYTADSDAVFWNRIGEEIDRAMQG